MATSVESNLETYTIKNGIKVIERFFVVPLDYSSPEGPQIQIFARHMIPTEKAKTPEDEAKLPFLVYLQGGPGFEIALQGNSGHAGEIHGKGYQTLWLDQRGTGLSSPVLPETLPADVKTDQQIAEYLSYFRADNIVRDCELIREQLLGHKEKPEDRKWTLMGQSFGGFCAITYLSFFSEGVQEVFLTGGLAPLVDDPDPVYKALVPRIIKRNDLYYRKYPRDVQRVREIMSYLQKNDVRLPNGGKLTPSRWQQLGIAFGGSGGIDGVHQLVLRASNDLQLFGKISYKTLQLVEGQQPFDGNPIYAILHEACYCQGRASNWSADRIVEDHFQFSWDKVQSADGNTPVYFTGEQIFSSMFDDYKYLTAWKGAAEILAKKTSWPPLYDLEQLSRNSVKVSAVSYFDDMYVDFNLSQDTASKINNTEQYITNQLGHDGLREDPKHVMQKLFHLSKREID
ncbi:alpha/beta-hydrolase [Pluteus cervinus]|uniref:Alpha/beta-hydrolase n=1 Tax=Pluteus cervinus TaxID=181527 RepID=A0ACD3B9Z1_9AGAR|nr:alpha/beta-hydrolase [Pluteus cervinus]